jgi:hypothetical protein
VTRKGQSHHEALHFLEREQLSKKTGYKENLFKFFSGRTFMKMRSLKAMALLFAVATISTSNAFAANFVERHFNRDSSLSQESHCHLTPAEIHQFIIRMEANLAQVNGNLNALFNMEGTLARNNVNPFTPSTGVFQYLDAINGTGPGSNGQAAANILSILNQLNVNPNLLAQIGNEFTVIVALAESYAVAVNTNASIQTQFQLALQWLASAQRLAGLLETAGVTSFVINPVTGQEDNIAGLLGTLTTLQTQIVQAFRAVLDGPNNVGAIPGDLDSQMNAIILLRTQISRLFGTIGALVVRDLACPGRGQDHDSSSSQF